MSRQEGDLYGCKCRNLQEASTREREVDFIRRVCVVEDQEKELGGEAEKGGVRERRLYEGLESISE